MTSHTPLDGRQHVEGRIERPHGRAAASPLLQGTHAHNHSGPEHPATMFRNGRHRTLHWLLHNAGGLKKEWAQQERAHLVILDFGWWTAAADVTTGSKAAGPP